jgi:hypothetical protein
MWIAVIDKSKLFFEEQNILNIASFYLYLVMEFTDLQSDS